MLTGFRFAEIVRTGCTRRAIRGQPTYRPAKPIAPDTGLLDLTAPADCTAVEHRQAGKIPTPRTKSTLEHPHIAGRAKLSALVHLLRFSHPATAFATPQSGSVLGLQHGQMIQAFDLSSHFLPNKSCAARPPLKLHPGTQNRVLTAR